MQDTIPQPARDALEAVQEAIDIPHAASLGDDETRTAILLHRVRDAVVMLSSILDGDRSAEHIAWSVEYLRERLAEHPAAVAADARVCRAAAPARPGPRCACGDARRGPAAG